MAINTTILTGRLVADPVLRYTSEGTAVANGSIAVADGYGERKKTYFFDYTAWAHTAEYLANYGYKGMLIAMSGKLTQNRWLSADGTPHTRVAVQVTEVVLPGNNKPATDTIAPDTEQDLYAESVWFDESDLPFG